MPMPPSWPFFLCRVRVNYPACLPTIRRVHLAVVFFVAAVVITSWDSLSFDIQRRNTTELVRCLGTYRPHSAPPKHLRPPSRTP
ncbi:hypothetical protein VTO73DRAFT_8348 [Trametes versicolor]